MKLRNLIYWIKPPCKKCPYTLGHVKFVASPCPACKIDNYKMYHMLTKMKYKPCEVVEKEKL